METLELVEYLEKSDLYDGELGISTTTVNARLKSNVIPYKEIIYLIENGCNFSIWEGTQGLEITFKRLD